VPFNTLTKEGIMPVAFPRCDAALEIPIVMLCPVLWRVCVLTQKALLTQKFRLGTDLLAIICAAAHHHTIPETGQSAGHP
jgi:hypothetical protein